MTYDGTNTLITFNLIINFRHLPAVHIEILHVLYMCIVHQQSFWIGVTIP